MATITYEFKVPPKPVCGFSSVAWYAHAEPISGETKEEISAKATQRAKELGSIETFAVGLHNRKADWEAVFGAPENPAAANYVDTFSQNVDPPLKWWERLLSRLYDSMDKRFNG